MQLLEHFQKNILKCITGNKECKYRIEQIKLNILHLTAFVKLNGISYIAKIISNNNINILPEDPNRDRG